MECSHAWLEMDGLIADITASQFDSELPEVYVSPDRSWHSRFEDLERFPSDFGLYDSNTARQLGQAYSWLCRTISGQ